MEAKLIKKVEYSNDKEIYYSLIANDKCIGTTHNVFNKEMKDNNENVVFNKLSKQNCDEIFEVKQWDRTCLDCNEGFNFEQMISNHKCCPYCEGVNYACVFYEQPTEVEVMIVMEEVQEIYRDGTVKWERCPKLDSEGCLILKKI
jgi:hypothetical protein